jgi:hypothetical protein
MSTDVDKGHPFSKSNAVALMVDSGTNDPLVGRLRVGGVVSAAADAETPNRLGATKAMAPSGSIRRTSWFNILVQPHAPGADASMLEREEAVRFVDAT